MFVSFPQIQSLFIFTTRFFIIGYECANPSIGGCESVVDSFSYFTVLTFWGLAFYFAFAALHTLTYALRGRPLLDAWPRPLQALHALFYTTVVVFPWLVTIVYWAVLYTDPWYPTEFAAFSNVAQHALNAAFALFEIVVPRTAASQMRPVHMLWLIVLLALYLGLAYLTYERRGFYVYPFLDPDANGPGILVAYIFGIAVGTLLVFGIVKGLVWVRQWLTERVVGMDGKFAGQPSYDQEMGTIGRGRKAARSRGDTDGAISGRQGTGQF